MRRDLRLRYIVALALALAAVGWQAGCAGATLTQNRTSLPVLVARQRAYPRDGAEPPAWSQLAAEFGELRSATGAPPDVVEGAVFGHALALVYAGRGTDATAALEGFVARYPAASRSGHALQLLADEYARAGRDNERRRALRTIINDHPSSPHAADAWAALWPGDGAGLGGRQKLTAWPAVLPASVHATPTVVQELGLGIGSVVIDPGHGGEDPGAVVAGRPHEKVIVLEVAIRLAERLRAAGLNAMLTREADVFLPLGARNAMATSHGADLFVSLHVNHAERADASGTETWIAAPARDERSALVAARENLGAGSTSELADYVGQLLSETKTEESRALAQAIQAELVAATGSVDRGVKEAGFVVLLGLRVPSVLVEMGFLSNPAEAELLAADSYRQALAEGISAGILSYVRSSAYIP